MGQDEAVTRYLATLEARNFAASTIRYKQAHIARFRWWLMDQGRPSSLTAVSEETARDYRRFLAAQPIARTTWTPLLHTMRTFFRWLHRHDYVLVDPFAGVDVPRREKSLPAYLTQDEVRQLLESIPLDGLLGIRDRAILETIYSSALRIRELISLDLTDVDLSQRVLLIRQGKGKKDRVVPLGRMAARFIERYIRHARVASRSHAHVLFVSDTGQRLTESHVRRYILLPALRSAGIQKHVTLHVLRHSCAIHLLENGASVRDLQVLLGHAKLSTTQKYLTVIPTRLKKVHTATHPSERQSKPVATAPNRLHRSRWDPPRR